MNPRSWFGVIIVSAVLCSVALVAVEKWGRPTRSPFLIKTGAPNHFLILDRISEKQVNGRDVPDFPYHNGNVNFR